jgi:hypothetical protein
MELTEHKPADVIETRETPLWFFANHPNPQACLDKNRDYEVELDDWWRFCYDKKREDWLEIGLDVPAKQMFFSGFASQGDGACFDACTIDWEKFWPQLTGKYPMLAQFKAHLPQPELHHSGRYSHEYSVSISLDDPYGYAETEVVDAAIRQRFPRMPDYTMSVYRDHYEIWDSLAGRYHDRFAYELSQLEDELRDLLRDKMRELYAYLEEDYDSLTSDEFLRDRFTDDDTWLFAEDGTIHYV